MTNEKLMSRRLNLPSTTNLKTLCPNLWFCVLIFLTFSLSLCFTHLPVYSTDKCSFKLVESSSNTVLTKIKHLRWPLQWPNQKPQIVALCVYLSSRHHLLRHYSHSHHWQRQFQLQHHVDERFASLLINAVWITTKRIHSNSLSSLWRQGLNLWTKMTNFSWRHLILFRYMSCKQTYVYLRIKFHHDMLIWIFRFVW